MIKALGFIIFPPYCVCCNKLFDVNIDYLDQRICKSCFLTLKGFISHGNNCSKCSLKLDENNLYEIKSGLCKDCIESEEDVFYDKHISFLQYNKYLSSMLRDFKFGENKYIGEVFIKVLEEEIIKNKELFESFDYITYVPLHKERQKNRGFNQSEIITKNICDLLNLNYDKNIIIKTKNNKPQSTVELSEKKKNVKNVFIVNRDIFLKNKRILVIDDIFTTGNTINECAKVLKEAGVREVFAFTVMKAGKKY